MVKTKQRRKYVELWMKKEKKLIKPKERPWTIRNLSQILGQSTNENNNILPPSFFLEEKPKWKM